MNHLITMLLQNNNFNLKTNVKLDKYYGHVSEPTMNRLKNSTVVQFDTNSNHIDNDNYDDDNDSSSSKEYSNNNKENNVKGSNSFENNVETADAAIQKASMLNVDFDHNFYSISTSTMTSFESAQEQLGQSSQTSDNSQHSNDAQSNAGT